ncbi:DUF1631 domain-containing protein [Ideonella azotifigens]|uniref:DUF1631 domain-containing protein n=3 Tax=Ideonella azotifigens TaxID=513160 RepID=A0ABN1K9R0_9BURK|nr:DUF1631 family protein [Ideonella azotifigens]MCD2339017.1 DUF1631 domain-containing protein [Ideonella azotifigens]
MPDAVAGAPTIDQARHFFADQVLKDLQPLREAAIAEAHVLLDQTAERAVMQLRQDTLQDLMRNGSQWLPLVASTLRAKLLPEAPHTTLAEFAGAFAGGGGLQLVDDATIQRNILISRLTLAVLDRTTWEFADLRARLTDLSGQSDLDDDDLFRPQVVARGMLKAWLEAGLTLESWRMLENVLHKACSEHVEKAFHATNQWLIERGVLPRVDLRPFIRRSDGTSTSPTPLDTTSGAPSTTSGPSTQSDSSGWSEPQPLGPNISRVMPASLSQGSGQGGQHPSGQRAQGGQPQGGAVARGGAGGPGLSMRPQAAGYRTGVAGAPGQDGPGGEMAEGQGGQGGWTTGPGGATPPGAGGIATGPGGPGGPGRAGGGVGGIGGYSTGYHTGASTGMSGGLDDETRMMTRQAGGGALQRAEAVLGQFSDILERHLPGFRDQAPGRGPSQQLSQAMAQAQIRVVAQVEAQQAAGGVGPSGELLASPAQLVAELRERQQTLKQAAATPEERATVELVALLFQSILTDERIPALLRIWFARLQMPVLRVALAEPDFFSGADHPARRLIDRLGACVMGFEGDAEVIGTPLEAEIRRVVQVVEAFPDTGRRVFQAVLSEFEKFLERYFSERNDATKAGVSLAQQIEQRETLAIQYTIELRKMLNELPVQEGVRDFLFHIWADVLATTAVRHGPHSHEVKTVRDAAADLMWAAGSKTTREERAEVIRRLPPLLGVIRRGMNAAGLDARKQEDAVKALNLALTAAFSARATSVSPEQLEHLKQRLATIEELMPDDDLELDDSWVLDEANHRNEGLEIVSEGGSMPGPSMLAAAAQLQPGSAYTLELRGRRETVRLSWQGMHKQLSLFVGSQGRCVLFQKTRLAAFLQAGLLVPVQDESLTISATRDALRKLSADPSRLMADA